MPSITFEWRATRRGNTATVREYLHHSDGFSEWKEFGPMRSNLVPSFIQARRYVIARIMAEKGHTSAAAETPDYTYLTPPTTETLQ